ncbi:uncharacterized protein VTP21DRAFT_30 [Calcarisporiella thermophila]|uniref:uncharacterized protein n=1 Tax=Calcarisporiella thermophila TaxID=911321 RepID=UPI003742E533
MAMIQFENFHGFLVGEENSQRGLIVIQEWWGLNDHIKDLTTRFSEQGFLCIAPDLYYGKTATQEDEAGHLMNNLDWEDAIKMVGAAARHLKSKGVKSVGVTGFCMGGAMSLASAVRVPEVAAASVFYGIPPSSIVDVTKPRVPVQFHFGVNDTYVGFSDLKTAKKLQESLKDHPTEFHYYEGTGHAFMNKTRPQVYNEEASKIAFQRTVDFFKKHL